MYGASRLVAPTFRAFLRGAIHNGLVDNQAPKSTSTMRFARPNAWCHPAMMRNTRAIEAAIVRTRAVVPMAQALLMIPAHLNVVMAGCHCAGAGGLYVDPPNFGCGRNGRKMTSVTTIRKRAAGTSPMTTRTSAESPVA